MTSDPHIMAFNASAFVFQESISFNGAISTFARYPKHDYAREAKLGSYTSNVPNSSLIKNRH
jgi:hypothetical protein